MEKMTQLDQLAMAGFLKVHYPKIWEQAYNVIVKGEKFEKDRIEELEKMAFMRTTGEDIQNLLNEHDEEHGTNLRDEYDSLVYGEE